MEDDKQDVLKLDFVDWPLPESYLVEVGRLSVLWASVEVYLDLSIGELAGFTESADPIPFILIRHTSFPQRLDIFAALCEQLVTAHPNLEGYKRVVSELKSARAQRSRFTHNSMVYNAETGSAQLASGSARGKLKATVEKVELADIRRASMQVHEAMVRLHSLVTGVALKPRWERNDAPGPK